MKILFLSAVVLGLSGSASAQAPSGYKLEPQDQVRVDVDHLPELQNVIQRVDDNGMISLPLVGRFQASGKSLPEVEDYVRQALKRQLVRPQVAVSMVDSRSQTVSVMGQVQAPGVIPVQGSKRLFDVISQAGGLKPDAGYYITVRRSWLYGKFEVEGAKDDESTQSSVLSVPSQDLLTSEHPASNIQIRAHDAISVPRASVIYVIGEVKKSGGFTMPQQYDTTVLKALSLAEGLTPSAKPSKAKILRLEEPGGRRAQIDVNVSRIMDGKQDDLALKPDDILMVPNNLTKKAGLRVIEVALQTASGLVIWRGL
jgi:polysaccharide export outer membrane protein